MLGLVANVSFEESELGREREQKSENQKTWIICVFNNTERQCKMVHQQSVAER
jgi:hypothetical protein